LATPVLRLLCNCMLLLLLLTGVGGSSILDSLLPQPA
jgi:hypothetical protein